MEKGKKKKKRRVGCRKLPFRPPIFYEGEKKKREEGSKSIERQKGSFFENWRERGWCGR